MSNEASAESAEKDLVGIVVGGGPAPGINGIISSVVIEAINDGKKVVGIVGGFKGLFEGQQNIVSLTINDVSRIHTKGGSILRTSRDTLDRAQEKFNTLLATLRNIGIRYLVTIGGDGTLYMANWIEREAHGEISVVHTPKTIDNDILLPGGVSTFGYQTARQVAVYIVDNIMEDARTTGRWYFITVMGRHAGHLALGTGEAAGATLSLIPEEFGNGKLSFKKVADILVGSIIKRISMNRDYGVAILAEGISEKFDLTELGMNIKRNEKGELKLSEVQLGKLLKTQVNETLQSMGIKINIVDKDIGYELRAADPIPYDVEYVRSLGYGAIRFLLKGGSGAMVTRYDGDIKMVAFSEMVNSATGKMKIRVIDTASEDYEVARKYMIRLEKEDFVGEYLEKLANIAKMKPEDFKARFEYTLS